MQMPYKEAVQKYLYTKHFSISSALEKKRKKVWHSDIYWYGMFPETHRKKTHISVKREQLGSLLSWHCILILLIPGNLLGRLIVQSWGPATVPGIATMKTPNYTNCNQNVNHRKKAANRQAQLDLTCIIEAMFFTSSSHGNTVNNYLFYSWAMTLYIKWMRFYRFLSWFLMLVSNYYGFQIWKNNTGKDKPFQNSINSTVWYWQAPRLKTCSSIFCIKHRHWKKKKKGKRLPEEIQSDRQSRVKILLQTCSVIMLVP